MFFRYTIAIATALVLTTSVAFGRPVPAGAGSTVFKDVPVAPGAFPDYGRRAFGIKGNPRVQPQAFNFASYSDGPAMLQWYRAHLPHRGWHIDQSKANYPGPGYHALIASRSGEAVTVIVQNSRGGCRVSIIKLNSSK